MTADSRLGLLDFAVCQDSRVSV